jgi:hypothetical protein
MGPHGSLDWQRNDRLGRIQRQPSRPPQHRRSLLRAIRRDANAYANSYCYADDHTQRYANSHSYRYIYSDTETFTDAETGVNA